MDHVAEMSRYFHDRLSSMALPAEIRMKGLAIRLEFEEADAAERLIDRCRKRGWLLADSGEGLVTLFPALNIDRRTAKEGLDILERCLRGGARAARRA